MGKPPTEEPCAGEPHARFGGRGGATLPGPYHLDNFKSYFGKNTLLTDIRYVYLETYQSHLKQKLTKGGTLRKPATINREMFCLH